MAGCSTPSRARSTSTSRVVQDQAHGEQEEPEEEREESQHGSKRAAPEVESDEQALPVRDVSEEAPLTPRPTMSEFSVNDAVMHDMLGEGRVRKISRSDDTQSSRVLFEWKRDSGVGKRKKTEVFNRWVLQSTLKKLRSSPRCAHQPARASASAPTAADDVADYPELAQHERARATKKLRTEGQRGRAKVTHVSKETKIPLRQRLEEFPDKGLTISAGVLFCKACKLTLDNIKSSIEDHLRRQKHILNLERLQSRNVEDTNVLEDLAAYFEEHRDEAGRTVGKDVHLYRYRCVEVFLATGTPLERCDAFRPLLERSGFALTDSSHMRATYIPRVLEMEVKTLKAELDGEYLTLPFDGTTRLGEAVAQTCRWCDGSFSLNTRLLTLKTSKKHMNAKQLAAMLTVNIQAMGIRTENVVCFPRDSCATNGAALRLLLGNPFIYACDAMCICHMLSGAGERIELPVLAEFTTPWLELVGGRDPHAGARALWRDTVAPTTVPGFSNVRWWSKAEIQMVLAQHCHELKPFIALLQARGIGQATTTKMANILQSKYEDLTLELAAILDVRHLVKTTYDLEGDRLEILVAYERLESLRSFGRQLARNEDGMLPNVDSLLRSRARLENGVKIMKPFPGHGLFEGIVVGSEMCDSTLYPGEERRAYRVRYEYDQTEEDLEEEELRRFLRVTELDERKRIAGALSSAFEYLESRLRGTCERQYDASAFYDMCRLVQVFNPQFAAQYLTPAWIDELVAKVTPLSQWVDASELKQQCHRYLAAAATFQLNTSTDVEQISDSILQWWRANGKNISAWASAARIVFSFTPSSASVERVFARLRNMYGENQDSSLSDQVLASLMLSYNARKIG